METFFELKLITLESNRFPRRKVTQIILGYFSSLTKAEQFMCDTITQQTFDSTYGFYIYERYIDTGCQEPKHICSYNAKGEQNDKQSWSDSNGNLFSFHYRPKDKIRFKVGDIVEEMYHDEVVLGIVSWLQPDKDVYEKLKIHWQHLIEEDECYKTRFRNDTCMDSSDDCYGIYWLGKGDTHSHVQAVDLFPPSRPVPETIIKNLKKKLVEMQSCRLKINESRMKELNIIQKFNIESGFPELDKITHGWIDGNLIVIGGRPAIGKTAFGVSLLREIAIKNRIPTAFFSLEMTNKQLTGRLMTLSQVELEKIYEYQSNNLTTLSEEELYKIKNAENQIKIAPIYFDDTPSLTIQELYKKTIRLVSEFQVKLIIIDYLQLIDGSGLSCSNRSEEIACIARGLKALAKDLNIPIIAFSQLNRNVENRKGINGKRPRLSDLCESYVITQNADVVCLVHRPDYYKIYADTEGNDLRGTAEIIVAQNRNGNTGIVRLKFSGEYHTACPS